jgi:hypothetical protein
MADTKISALSAITGVNIADGDHFVVVDTTTSPQTTKRIIASELRKMLVGTKGVVDSTMSFTTEGSATPIQPGAIVMAIQAVANGSHTGTTSIDIEGSNDTGSPMTWVTLGTVSVTGNSGTDGLGIDLAAWSYIRGNCTSHGDDSNAVTLHISY